MIANNTGEVIESDQYGEAVFHAVDHNMDEQDLVIQLTNVLVQAECVHSTWLLGFLLPPLLKRQKGGVVGF